MTTTIERLHTSADFTVAAGVYFEENPDLTVRLLRGGDTTAKHAEGGIVVTYLDVDDFYSQVSVDRLHAYRGSSLEVIETAIERLTTVRDELRRLTRMTAPTAESAAGLVPEPPHRRPDRRPLSAMRQ